MILYLLRRINCSSGAFGLSFKLSFKLSSIYGTFSDNYDVDDDDDYDDNDDDYDLVFCKAGLFICCKGNKN